LVAGRDFAFGSGFATLAFGAGFLAATFLFAGLAFAFGRAAGFLAFGRASFFGAAFLRTGFALARLRAGRFARLRGRFGRLGGLAGFWPYHPGKLRHTPPCRGERENLKFYHVTRGCGPATALFRISPPRVPTSTGFPAGDRLRRRAAGRCRAGVGAPLSGVANWAASASPALETGRLARFACRQ
jgi:hypothetical protein